MRSLQLTIFKIFAFSVLIVNWKRLFVNIHKDQGNTLSKCDKLASNVNKFLLWQSCDPGLVLCSPDTPEQTNIGDIS